MRRRRITIMKMVRRYLVFWLIELELGHVRIQRREVKENKEGRNEKNLLFYLESNWMCEFLKFRDFGDKFLNTKHFGGIYLKKAKTNKQKEKGKLSGSQIT